MTVIPLSKMWGLLPGLLNGWKHINNLVSRLHLCGICIFIIIKSYYLADRKLLNITSLKGFQNSFLADTNRSFLSAPDS